MTHLSLRAKYGDKAFDAGLKIQPGTFEERVAQRDSLDQHFTRLWLDFAVTGVGSRSGLDDRSRFLVLVGQYTMAKADRALEDTVRAALVAGVAAREILEVILQCAVYGGHTTVDPAIATFHRIAAERGLLEELRASQLPLNGIDDVRSIDSECEAWHPDDVADSRFERFMARYGWLAVGRGLTLRPRHHLDFLGWLDELDPEFAKLWIEYTYHGLYARGNTLDDKTRLLCTVGDCLAVGELGQAREHMRGALRSGASARELMEVIFLIAVNFGMPAMVEPLRTLVQILAEDGRARTTGSPA